MNYLEKIVEQIIMSIEASFDREKGFLEDEEIQKHINAFSNIASTPHGIVYFDLNNCDLEFPLSDSIKLQITRAIETRYNVKMKRCSTIEGTKQKQRDNTWWNTTKKKEENKYWSKYKNYLSFAPSVKQTIDDDTDHIMNLIFNPEDSHSEDSRYGMVMGHVQSGKTSNYAGLICKAADAGYKLFIIIAGSQNILRSQTQKRIESIFKGINDSDKPIFLTDKEFDFGKRESKTQLTTRPANINVPLFLVIKKNTRTLDNVLVWLGSQLTDSNCPVLMIDDEADNASVNTKEEDDPTAINQKIRKILGKLKRFAYVAYTATPFANIFIDDEATNKENGKDLFPEDFIVSINPSNDYIGAEKLFLKENNNIVVIDDYIDAIPPKHKKEFELDALPQSLKLAIRIFVINIAIRNLRNQRNKHNSMLIHGTRFVTVHRSIAYFVKEYLNSIVESIELYGEIKNSKNKTIQELKSTFFAEHSKDEFTWTNILDEINLFYNSIDIKEIHSKAKDTIEYDESEGQNIILIGGNSLSRGFTVEGLTVSYFLRNACASDTLMQMGRWFGYRSGYSDICRIFIPLGIKSKFESVADCSLDLFEKIDYMRDHGLTPKDFGIAVKKHPDSFLITARNKMKCALEYTHEVGLDGFTKETSWVYSNDNIIASNLDEIKSFFKQLYSTNSNPIEHDNSKYLWTDIDASSVSQFVEKFQFVPSYEHLPINMIKQYLNEYDTDTWRVAIVGAKNGKRVSFNDRISIGMQKRKVQKMKGEYEYYELGSNRQVTSGNVEKFGFTLQEIKKMDINSKTTRKYLRSKAEYPVLMIHLIDPQSDQIDTNAEHPPIPALSFTFPASEDGRYSRTIKYMVNSVYRKEFEENNSMQETDDV